MSTAHDPVLAKRARVARWVSLGQRFGYGAYLLSIVFFLWAVIGRATATLATLSAGFLIVGSIVLLPAIIFGYAVKAAEREDRERAAAKAARATEPSSDES